VISYATYLKCKKEKIAITGIYRTTGGFTMRATNLLDQKLGALTNIVLIEHTQRFPNLGNLYRHSFKICVHDFILCLAFFSLTLISVLNKSRKLKEKTI